MADNPQQYCLYSYRPTHSSEVYAVYIVATNFNLAIVCYFNILTCTAAFYIQK